MSSDLLMVISPFFSTKTMISPGFKFNNSLTFFGIVIWPFVVSFDIPRIFSMFFTVVRIVGNVYKGLYVRIIRK